MSRLIGQRIMLREYRPEDITGMRSWVTDPRITRFMGASYARPETWEQTEMHLSRILNGDAGGVHWVIADIEGGAYLGQCDLMHIDYLSRKAELTIVLPYDNCGRGIGREAVGLLTGFAFRVLNLNRVYLHVYPDNLRAVRCYERCGFKTEGVKRQDTYRDGQYVDRCIMSLLREDFDAL